MLNLAILLYHFVMQIIVLSVSKLINLADAFCHSVLRYTVDDGPPRVRIMCIIIQQQQTCPRQ